MRGEEDGELPSEKGEVPIPPKDVFEQFNANWWDGGQKTKSAESFIPRRLDTPLDKMVRSYGGRR